MNSSQFNLLLQNYTALYEDEVNDLISLCKRYPYFQILHILLARASADLNLPKKDYFLHKSAVYSTDRSVLKSILTKPIKNRVDLTPVEKSAPNVSILEDIQAQKNNFDFQKSTSNSANEHLHLQVITDLSMLSNSMAHYEKVMEQLKHNTITPLPSIDSSEKKQALPTTSTVDFTSTEDDLIGTIEHSKKQFTSDIPPSQKDKIIDEFIKSRPSISPAKSIQDTNEDLSEKYDLFSDEIVSETLVDLLIQQGKKEKALELLKKLIWKYPQKKAYFAIQIENLKK